MYVLGDYQCDEHIGIEQGRHSSSASDRTSSDVTTLPTLTTGSPVLESTETAAG